MYEMLKGVLLPLLKVPSGPPAPPPGHENGGFLKVFRASPAYLRYRIFFWLLYAGAWGLMVALVAVGVALVFPWWTFLLLLPLFALAVAKAAVLYLTTRLDYEMRWYIVTDRSLRLREGVWTIRELTLTFANVQNVHLLQGPVERLFGFSNVLVETAGGGAGQKERRLHDPHRALLRGLDNPAVVRDLILNLLRRYRSAGLGDREERIATQAGASRPVRRLPIELLTEIRDAARSLRQALTRHD